MAGAWNDNGRTTLTVRTSDGTKFTPNHWLRDAGRWFDASVFVAGDFDGDHLTDIAQLWNDIGSNSIKVYTSVGTSFVSASAWASRDGGIPLNVKWAPGDFTGDGRSDIAAVWEKGGANVLTVRISNGVRFHAEHWSENNGGWIPTTAWCAGTFDADHP